MNIKIISVSAILVLAGALALVVMDNSGKVGELEDTIVQQNVRILDYEDLVVEQREQVEAHKEFIKVLREQSDASAYDFSYMKDLIEGATQTVSDIKKLEEADKELLAKYSKIFFLNEHYTPESLAYIPDDFVLSDKKLEIHKEVQPFLVDMLNKMKSAGLKPLVVSSFRSFDYQEGLKDRNVVTYGEGTANQFVADQGYSEHQLGTTVDIGVGPDLLKFEPTDEYNWLVSNAYKHGFALSYPENNTYYEFEPWHWRFVGIELATELKNQGKYFYDLPQREIDGYRLEMFGK